MTSDPHAAHPDATLSIAEPTPDGGLLHQSWTICACTLPALRAHLGTPHHQTIATRAQVEATGAAVLSVDSGAYLGGQE